MITIEQTPDGFSVDVDGQKQVVTDVEQVCQIVEAALGGEPENEQTETGNEFEQGFAQARGGM